MSEQRTGAQIMCEALIRDGIEVMFGIPGGAIMPFYYAMWEYREQLRHVLCRHEQGAGHAAEGYARASGRLGVCIGTSGPGTTNLVTPIADAMMDSTPLLAITGQVSKKTWVLRVPIEAGLTHLQLLPDPAQRRGSSFKDDRKCV